VQSTVVTSTNAPCFESYRTLLVTYDVIDDILITATLVDGLLSSRLLSKNVKVKIYKTTILPIVLYGCQTWSLTLREEHRLRVFENRVLRRIFAQ
jgi:hypothetical protein